MNAKPASQLKNRGMATRNARNASTPKQQSVTTAPVAGLIMSAARLTRNITAMSLISPGKCSIRNRKIKNVIAQATSPIGLCYQSAWGHSLLDQTVGKLL